MAAESSEQFVLLNRLADEFAARYRRGERPSLQEYIDRHPELADEIREFFPAMAEMEQVREDRQQVLLPLVAGALPPLELLGDFRIIRELGHGGMGVVYEAEQVSLGRHVALKVLPKQLLLDARSKRRFEREAKAAAKLHHTNIVPVFGVGEHDGLPYYVMQFIPGLGLDEVLVELKRLPPGVLGSGSALTPIGGLRASPREHSAADVARSLLSGQFVSPRPSTSPKVAAEKGAGGSIPVGGRRSDMFADAAKSGAPSGPKKSSYWQSVARVGVQVADALQHAHSQGILHRDIKPSNLLLDVRGTVWVTDFGLAKADDQQNLTQTGDVMGTLRYMPPEAFEGQADARGDVYSLGLTLYELLALRPAFDARDRPGLVKRVTTAEPSRLDRVNTAIPRDLVTIVEKATAPEPARRYATAGELGADLQRFLDDQPIQARRVSALEQLARWGRHHPGVAAALVVIAVLLSVAAVASSVAAWRFERLAGDRELARAAAEDTRQQAEEAADEARRHRDAERWERYCSNIAAAAGALQLQNTGSALSALGAAPLEHRNWEWQHFHSQLDSARHVLSGPRGSIQLLVLSPTGRQIAVCHEGHSDIDLCDVSTGRLEATLRGHTAGVASLVYRPDGKQIAAGAADLTIRVWDVATGRQGAMWRIEYAPPQAEGAHALVYSQDGSRIASFASPGGAGTCRLWEAVSGREIAVLGDWHGMHRDVAFSPDGKQVAATSKEFVRLCDAVSGRPLALLGPHQGPVYRVLYSPDGKWIASVAGAGSPTIHLWHGLSGKEAAVLRGHTAGIIEVQFSPDGSRLISGSAYPDNTARLWDAASGRALAVLAGHKNSIDAAVFSPNGRRIATASLDQSARLWDGHTGQLLAVLGGHTARVMHVVFNPKGTRLITASEDATLRLWNAETGEWIGVLRGHGDGFQIAPVFSPDGFRLMSGSRDGTVRHWDVGLHERNGILRGHTGFVYDVAFSPDGEQVASAGWDGTARLWDPTTGRQICVLKHKTEIIGSVAYSSNGRQLVTVERERGITLWDVASQKSALAWRAPAGYWAADTRAVLNPAGTLLAAGGVQTPGPASRGPVRLWDVAGGQELAQLHGHERCSIDVAFHPDGRLLATAGEDGTVRLWDVASRTPRAVLRGHTDAVGRIAFRADGTLLASGSSDKTIRFWEIPTGEPSAVISVGSVVHGLAFSPDGTRLAAGCADNTIRLFDVDSRQQVAELHGHTNYVHAVAWSPDGTRLVSGSGDTTVRVWDALPPAARARSPQAYVPPRGYVCYRAASPIKLEGRLDDAAWQVAPWTEDFVDIEGDRRLPPRLRTRVKMLWDDQNLYIGAELEEPHVQGTLARHDSYIFHDDNDFEVFINPGGDNHNYAELEMNALNTTWDLRLRKPYRDGGKAEDDWEIPGLKSAVQVHGTINNPRDTDKGWTIEIAIPWEIVHALNDNTQRGGRPGDGEQWRINFSRVQWRFDIVKGQYVRRKGRREDNWVWSPQGAVNMHQPETWGYVQFSTAAPGHATFQPDPAGAAKHLLHRIYYAQRVYHEERGRYAATLAELGLADLGHETLAGPPRIEAVADGFKASVDIRLPGEKQERWSIRQDSLVGPDR